MSEFAGKRLQFSNSEFLRYFFVSLLALAVDLGIFSASLRLAELPWAWAAVLGFFAGGLTAWWLSVHWVFRHRRFAKSPLMELGSFVAIGIAGLGITELVLWLGIVYLAFAPELSRLMAAGATFVFNFAVRKCLLFRKRPAGLEEEKNWKSLSL